MSSRGRIDELSRIEFDGAKAVTRYSKTAKELLKDFTRELEFSADEFEAVMREAARNGHPLLMGLDVKWRARRVSKRLRRAADCTQGAVAEVVRFHAAFRREFAEVLNPTPKKKRKFDFEDE
jgi:hypothetical protein